MTKTFCDRCNSDKNVKTLCYAQTVSKKTQKIYVPIREKNVNLWIYAKIV